MKETYQLGEEVRNRLLGKNHKHKLEIITTLPIMP